MHQGRLPTGQVPHNALRERKRGESMVRGQGKGPEDGEGPGLRAGKRARRRGCREKPSGEKWGWEVGGQRPGPPLRGRAHPASGTPGPPPASLTTLSSGTERLRVHSWLFTKESVGEKATCQDCGGTHTCAIRHQLAPMLPLPRPRPEDSAIQMGPQPSPLVP